MSIRQETIIKEIGALVVWVTVILTVIYGVRMVC